MNQRRQYRKLKRKHLDSLSKIKCSLRILWPWRNLYQQWSSIFSLCFSLPWLAQLFQLQLLPSITASMQEITSPCSSTRWGLSTTPGTIFLSNTQMSSFLAFIFTHFFYVKLLVSALNLTSKSVCVCVFLFYY